MRISLALAIAITLSGSYTATSQPVNNEKILSYIADPKKQDIRFYWKNDSDKIFRSIQNLKNHLERKNRQLIFAMNGGMYQTDNSPLGLYIENYKTITRLNRRSASGNFYMKPNGVFYIMKDNKAAICRTGEFLKKTEVQFATQSGPLLILDGKIHQEFKKGSANLNIRNGVGILPDNRILFAMSKVPVNFYEFAEFFKRQGCSNALYLDGAISQTFLPEKNWIQTGGNFGVIIGVSKLN
jgi:uncharacterized protein YigE (DUF2233 family)